ncbi:MBOAT family O-acyltransferase [Anaeromusa acidaminophila]|uniref:MBOAT family O-acyltransferase n=1 Tax=Anaeromusa acidaminophila TaxID=81464 RepID=UPI00037A35EA|nr:MBOAT family O-acyltransferase [Anaeromusa acidaminophila]
MLFNSYEFIFVFLPSIVVIYFFLSKLKLLKLATISLIGASLVFYLYWDVKYLPLLLISILFNYCVGLRIEATRKKTWLCFGVLTNLSLLGYFKYAGFLLRTINDVFGASYFVPEITLPLGISFFTFTQTAYLVDAYRGETRKYSFLSYFLFVTIFPHLIAGPILYHKDMIPQFSRMRNFIFSHKNFGLGLSFFVLGLFKKVVIADTLSPWVKIAFDNAQQLTLIDAWLGAILYTFQLYFDFSGYSEMAIGLGLMLNLKLPINFNSPYKATSIIDFWRRWHITLSQFLKNYLYIPLGGNREGEAKRLRNLMITMLLGGLWHGAGWTFIVWGGLHGIYLVFNHLWKRLNKPLPRRAAWGITFVCVIVAWVFFRASNLSDALAIIQAMLGMKGIIVSSNLITMAPLLFHSLNINQGMLYVENSGKEIGVMLLLFVVVLKMPNTQELVSLVKPTKMVAIAIVIIAVVSIFKINKVSEFLYFQF